MPEHIRHFRVATYNVHRWGGRTGRALMPARALRVIRELHADVLALQEVLLPWNNSNPLTRLAAALGMQVIFGATRRHRDGVLGNALLTRWTAYHVEQCHLSQTPWKYRGAIIGSYRPWSGQELCVIATHLALGARTRDHQVRWLLNHPRLHTGPLVLLGDLNAWCPTPATRALAHACGHSPRQPWPRTFPSSAPLLALDRIYTREIRVVDLQAHATSAARQASDHLPVVAQVAF